MLLKFLKLIDDKRFDYTSVEHVAEFITQVEEAQASRPMTKTNVVNYNET